MKTMSSCNPCEGCSGGEDSTCNRDWEKGSKKPAGLQQVVEAKAVWCGEGVVAGDQPCETRPARGLLQGSAQQPYRWTTLNQEVFFGHVGDLSSAQCRLSECQAPLFPEHSLPHIQTILYLLNCCPYLQFEKLSQWVAYSRYSRNICWVTKWIHSH